MLITADMIRSLDEALEEMKKTRKQLTAARKAVAEAKGIGK